MQILIPCKGLHLGKSRLAACLDEAERRELCRVLLTQTLQCALGVVESRWIHLLTPDPAAAALAERYAVGTIFDANDGLNGALEAARNLLLAGGGEEPLLIMPIDLPFASPDALTAAQRQTGDIVIATDQDGSGTNLLMLRGRSRFQFGFCYGTRSYAAHLAQARALGLTVSELSDWRLAFDLDDAAQYAQWRAKTAAGGPAVTVRKVELDKA